MGILKKLREKFFGKEEELVEETRVLSDQSSGIEIDQEYINCVNEDADLANHQFAWHLKQAVEGNLIKEYKKLMTFISKHTKELYSNDVHDIIPLEYIKPTEAIKDFIRIFIQFSYKTEYTELSQYIESNK